MKLGFLKLFRLFVVLMILQPIHRDGQARMEKAQGISVTDFKQEILILNNLHKGQGVTGAGITLASTTYVVRIEFQFSRPGGKEDAKRRFEIFSADPETKYNDPDVCAKQLCWKRMEGETRQFDPNVNPQEIRLNRSIGREVLITAWHPTATPTTDGRPDDYEGSTPIIDGKKKGVRLEFDAPYPAGGKTIVTILPCNSRVLLSKCNPLQTLKLRPSSTRTIVKFSLKAYRNAVSVLRPTPLSCGYVRRKLPEVSCSIVRLMSALSNQEAPFADPAAFNAMTTPPLPERSNSIAHQQRLVVGG